MIVSFADVCLLLVDCRALHELLEFRSGENDAAFRSMLPLNVKKMITREVELQQMRRSETSSSSNNNNTSRKGDSRQPNAPAQPESGSAFVLPELSGACRRCGRLLRFVDAFR